MATETALTTETTNSFDPNKIAADITTTLITEAIKSGWKTVKNFFQDHNAKDSIDYGDAYENYLENTIEKNSKIKTLIYRHVPKYLYSFYEYPNVQYCNKIIDTSNAKNLLDISNKLLITGTGGMGKSLLLKHLFLNTAQYGYYIPVLIELRKFNQLDCKDICLYTAIYQNLYNNGFNLNDEYYSYSLNAGGYLILLDGFDEVKHDKAQTVFEQIEDFSTRYNKNHFIISSRPSDRLMGWNDFHEVSLCNLTKSQAVSLIKKIDFDETVKQPFINALSTELFDKDKYGSFASNPLLLTIMLLTFSNHAALPENLNGFYEQAFLTLFDGHDATKDCFVRDIRSHLSYEDFKTVFAYICFYSYFKGNVEFSENKLRQYVQIAKQKVDNQSFSTDDFITDLMLSVCMMVKEGLNYRFIHRSFQEYFAAWYTCKLTDKDQYDLLTDWMSQSDACTFDKYMTMLFTLQKDKVNKIIFCPGIRKLKKLYDKSGFSCDFLKKSFKGISLTQRSYIDNGIKKTYYSIGLPYKDGYLCSLIQLICTLNKYSFPQYEIETREQEILQKIVESHENPLFLQCSFDEASSIVGEKELLYCLRWFDRQLHFCFALYERYNKKPEPGKRTIASILDEL